MVTSILLVHTEHLNNSSVNGAGDLGRTTTGSQSKVMQTVTAFPNNSFCRVATVTIKTPVTLPRTFAFVCCNVAQVSQSQAPVSLCHSAIISRSLGGRSFYSTRSSDYRLFLRFGGTQCLLLQGGCIISPSTWPRSPALKMETMRFCIM